MKLPILSHMVTLSVLLVMLSTIVIPTIMNGVKNQMIKKGLLSRSIAGYGDIRPFICPPCVITLEEADKMLDILLPIIAAIKPS